MSYKPASIKFAPTLNPASDETNQNTVGIIDAQNIRFFRGGIEKMGGWVDVLLNKPINGKPRSVLSFERENKIWTIIGTHTKLYARRAGQLYNITPLKTIADAVLGTDRKSTRLNSSHITPSRMPSSA